MGAERVSTSLSRVVKRMSRVVKRESRVVNRCIMMRATMSRWCQEPELSRECKAGSKHMSRRCQEGVKRVPNGCE